MGLAENAGSVFCVSGITSRLKVLLMGCEIDRRDNSNNSEEQRDRPKARENSLETDERSMG